MAEILYIILTQERDSEPLKAQKKICVSLKCFQGETLFLHVYNILNYDDSKC